MGSSEAKEAHLWGIDGELPGNEGRIMSALPFIVVGDKIAAARSFDWSLEPEQGLKWFSSEAEAKEMGTQLDLGKSFGITPGQCVVTLGPEFFQSARQIAGDSRDQLDSFSQAGGGFRVACLALDAYERLGRLLALEAKSVYDQAITSCAGKILDPRAQAALLAMRGNGFTRLEDVIVRRLIAARITRDADTYRIVKELAVIRLKESAETVERLVEDHFKILTEKAPFQRIEKELATETLRRVLLARVSLGRAFSIRHKEQRVHSLTVTTREGRMNELRSEGYRKSKFASRQESGLRKA